MMQQYFATKAQYPHTILLFRVGDFYETFGEDAIEAAEILGIVLTKRGNGSASEIELAGFPHHSLNSYLPKLVRAGKRVAVCDQLEDPKQAKGVVKRGVTEIVTPGIALSDDLLEQGTNNFLAALHFPDAATVGAAFLDVSTGEFFCQSGSVARVEKLLQNLRPSEVLVARGQQAAFARAFPALDFYVSKLDDWAYEPGYAHEQLLKHFGLASLKGFGLENEPHGTTAAGVLLHYLHFNEQHQLGHIPRLARFPDDQYVGLDAFTLRNLELLQPLHPDGKALVDVLDETRTPMGARLLRRWMSFPLRDRNLIEKRQRKVAALLADLDLHDAVARNLAGFPDLERLLARLATHRLGPREALALRRALEKLPPLIAALQEAAHQDFHDLLDKLEPVDAPLEILVSRLHPEAPAVVTKPGIIADGFSVELDDLRALKTSAEDYLERLRLREIQRTGITSLKVSFNKVFGYYLEVTHAHKHKVPEDFIRKQTLTNAERYITPELKEFEEKILTAEERILALEQRLYTEFLNDLQPFVTALQLNAALVAGLDVLLSFADTAQRHHYCRPTLADDGKLVLLDARHPVIEQLLPPDQPYVPNDLHLTPEERQVLLITGPNMAGKSALLRQTALITLLAQAGSYVPAREAHVGLVDQIFTRVGASDNLAAGESTFMVEMTEVARILNTATSASLVLLDEVGRGTSTFDGVSIAWALTEYLHNVVGAKTLFATHYHELAELGEQLPRVHNVNVSVQEHEGRIIFLRKLQPGASAHSFGINVAQLAGLPRSVVQRARELLVQFEDQKLVARPGTEEITARQHQMHLFGAQDPIANRVREVLNAVDINRLTPVEALLKLQELKLLLDA